MPHKLEAAIRRSARRVGIRAGTRRWRRYVFGTLARLKGRRRRRRR